MSLHKSKIRNTSTNYGVVSKLLHWLSTIIIFALFGLGVWMVELDYYSEWYKTAPDWHKSVGILLCITTIARLWWKANNVTPVPLTNHSAVVVRTAKATHFLLYMLLFIIFISGYLISTADGQNITVFTWFEIPAFNELFNNQADTAGLVHEYIAYIFIALIILHAIAAIKHHVLDKDNTLSRML